VLTKSGEGLTSGLAGLASGLTGLAGLDGLTSGLTSGLTGLAGLDGLKLFGRGSTDDKGPVLGWLHTIEAYQQSGIEIVRFLKFRCQVLSLPDLTKVYLT
jgi:hypothetical protein